MRRFIVPALAVLLGASMVPVIHKSIPSGPVSPHAAVGPGAPGVSPAPGTSRAPQEPHAEALRLLRDGYLHEAQDSFLKILAFHPEDEEALRGLVVVRQAIAGNDPNVLRRQAAEYWEAIKRGGDTEEHYSRRAMEQLIVASVQAAREIEARTPGPRTPPAVPPPEDKLLAPLPAPALTGKPGVPQTPASSGGTLAPPSAPAVKPPAPPPSGGKLAPPSARAVKPPAPPPPSGGKLAPPSAFAVKPPAPQPPAPATAPAQRGAEMPLTSPALQTLPPPAAKSTAPQTPPASTAPAQRGAEVPQTSPALQTLPPPAAKPTAPQAPPAATAPAQRGAEVPPTSPALQTAVPPTTDRRLYTVRVGPVSDRDRASAIAKQLVAGGFAQTRVTAQTAFRVVSEPLPRGAAENLAATLAGRGFRNQIEPLTRDTVQLLFGTFASQKDAEALSRRIAGAGYDAWVREGTSYTVLIGPYPQSSVNAITGIVHSGAPDERVTAEPVP
jgi:hypothetical protein